MLTLSPSAIFARRFLSRKGTILDLGCGGGKAFYSKAGLIAGVDLSLAPLSKARDIYDVVAQADALNLPFKDDAFDYVVSHDLIGHIQVDRKEKLISEIYRVLKKGGVTLHYIETKGNNIIERIAMRFPELYRKYFIEQDGHFGLEPPGQAIERFRSRGFRPVAEKKWASTFLRFPKEYLKRFDNEYVKESVFLAVIVGVSRFIRKTKILERPMEVLILVSDWFLKKFSSFDDSSGIYVCYEKK